MRSTNLHPFPFCDQHLVSENLEDNTTQQLNNEIKFPPTQPNLTPHD